MKREPKLMESRKDFYEYWGNLYTPLPDDEYLNALQEQPILNQLNKMNRNAFFIINLAKLPTEGANLNFGHTLGHDPKLLHKDLNYAFSQFHLDYLDFALQGSYRIMYNAWFSVPERQRRYIEFFRDFLYKKINLEGKSEYFRLQQHSMAFELDKNGNVAYTINLGTDISHLKRKNDASILVKMPDGKVNIYKYNAYLKTITEFGPFSKRELSILKLLSKRLESKEIALLLHISPHTVDKHRRNMLEKTNCMDTTALLVYAKTINLL